MTLLSDAQDVCDVIGLTRPSAILSSNEPLARQILGLAKETIEELGMMDWPGLQVPYSFNTVIGQASYDLPADWDRQTTDTVFSTARYLNLRGSLTPAAWAQQRSTALGPYQFRIFGLPEKINLTPTPEVVEAVTLEYVSTYRVRQADLSYKATFFADDDVSIIRPEIFKLGLKWRLRRAKGADYSEEFDVYEQTRAQRLAQALAVGSLPVSTRSPWSEDGSSLNVPENGFG